MRSICEGLRISIAIAAWCRERGSPSNTDLIWRADLVGLEVLRGDWHDPSREPLSDPILLVAVAEEGNVGRAAQRLRVAQPPLSRQIRALEDDLGAQLFERTPRGMTLLAPGRVLLDHARAILAAVDRAVVATRAETALLAAAPGPACAKRRG
jgi:hypothetical protein